MVLGKQNHPKESLNTAYFTANLMFEILQGNSCKQYMIETPLISWRREHPGRSTRLAVWRRERTANFRHALKQR